MAFVDPLVLELDLSDGVVEALPPGPFGRLPAARHRVVLREAVEGLRLAGEDPAVQGVVVRLAGHSFGVASAQELRHALTRFRAAGKWAVAWSESFGEFAQGTVPYYVATACDEIWLQPTGDLGLVGIAAEVTFLRGALDRMGVQVQVGARKEFKNAPNQLTERAFTPAHREATGRVVASVFDRIVADVAAARGIDAAAVRAAVDAGPLPAEEARERRLVDAVGYRDEVYDAVRRRAGSAARLLYLDRYRHRAGRRHPVRAARRRREPVIALVDVVGGIKVGRNGRSPLVGLAAGADTVTAALRAALRADSVRAVLLRVDSPGGSAVASDAIWRAVSVVQAAGKPVVVSMGDFAASGGYFVSVPAAAIVAQPGTLTGSIGVFGGKPVLDEALARLGVTTDAVGAGDRARLFSTRRAWTDADWDVVERFLDRVYDDFTARVAAGRRLSREEVEDVARGRVWTGADALERGLVDELGGIETALALARERAKLPGERGQLRPFPALSPVARLKPPTSSEHPAAAVAGADVFGEFWGSLAGAARRLGLPATGPLALPAGFTAR